MIRTVWPVVAIADRARASPRSSTSRASTSRGDGHPLRGCAIGRQPGRRTVAAHRARQTGRPSVVVSLSPRSGRALPGRRGRTLALVSGTNGKTTTRTLLVAALATRGPVVSNGGGANLPTGLTAALAATGRRPTACSRSTSRTSRWSRRPCIRARPSCSTSAATSLTATPRYGGWPGSGATPSAGPAHRSPLPTATTRSWRGRRRRAPSVIWVAAGQRWHNDAAVCPACGDVITRDAEGWSSALRADPADPGLGGRRRHCGGSGRRPSPGGAGDPGRGQHRQRGAGRGRGDLVGGRTRRRLRGDGRDRGGRGSIPADQLRRSRRPACCCAKNPAGWVEALSMLPAAEVGVVVAVNARAADGRDPSWLWDVPFESLQGRFAIATGERSRDVAVRLRYAGVDHAREDDAASCASRPRADTVRSRSSPTTPPSRPTGGWSAMTERPGRDPVRIALVFPSVLGTYGDGGNATVLAQRLRWRGLAAETISVEIDEDAARAGRPLRPRRRRGQRPDPCGQPVARRRPRSCGGCGQAGLRRLRRLPDPRRDLP